MASSHQDHQEQAQYVIEQDQFNRLPDDLVMLIINKLINVKNLIRLSVVSNRYSSLVFQTDSLFVDWDSYDPGLLGRLGRFVRNLVAKVTRASTLNILSRNTQKISVMKHGFRQIKHLHLHLSDNSSAGFLRGGKSDPSIRWVAAFGSCFEFLHYLIASSVNQSNCNSSVAGSSNYNLHGYYNEHSESLFRLVIKLLTNLRTRHDFIRTLVLELDHKMLESVVFSDDETGGNFIMRKEQIAQLQSNWEVSAYPADFYVSVTHVPTLHLPESGYTMNDVIVVSAIPADQVVEIEQTMEVEQMMEVDFRDDSVLDKWEVFDEAVRQSVNENRMPMYVSHIPSNVLH